MNERNNYNDLGEEWNNWTFEEHMGQDRVKEAIFGMNLSLRLASTSPGSPNMARRSEMPIG